MSDLISRSALIKALQMYFINNKIHKNDIAETIANIPTVEAKSVVHGKWEELKGNLARCYSCSECGLFMEIKTSFCPNCGADMRGEKHD